MSNETRTNELVLRYERGTIVLESSDPEADAASWPAALARRLSLTSVGLRWDPRTSTLRATADRYHELRRALVSVALAHTDRCARPAAIVVRPPPLRDYQAAALDAWQQTQRGIVVLPTGAGKTRVAIAAIEAVGKATLVLVPTRALMWQWQRELSRWTDGPVGVYGDGQQQLEAVTVATYASAFCHLDRFGDRFGLLVVDEAHHFARGKQTEALQMCTAGRRLGLTATLFDDDVEEGSLLPQLVGPVVFRQNIAQLSGAYLAPIDNFRLSVRLEAAELEDYRRGRALFALAYRDFRRAGGGDAWHEFVAEAQQTAIGRTALAGYFEARYIVAHAAGKRRLLARLLERHAAEPVLVFTADNEMAYALSRELLIPAVTCDIGRAERDALLGALQRGEIGALVSSRVLNEGIDLPDVRVGVIVGGTQGKREHIQRVGRLLRPRDGKRAVIYEMVCSATYEERDAQQRQLALVA